MSKGTVIEIEDTSAVGEKLELTLRGEASAIVKVLVSGIPREMLLEVAAAFQAELDKRQVASSTGTQE